MRDDEEEVVMRREKEEENLPTALAKVGTSLYKNGPFWREWTGLTCTVPIRVSYVTASFPVAPPGWKCHRASFQGPDESG